jgi:hypothetical protein
MSLRRFFVTGDGWGLVDIVPAENSAQFDRVRQQIAEHHKDTVFSPTGWATRPFILPSPVFSLSERQIPLAELGKLFADFLVPADIVETCEDFTGPAFVAHDCFAWGEPNQFGAGLYGRAPDGIIETLHTAEWFFDDDLARLVTTSLARLGAKYQRLLIAWKLGHLLGGPETHFFAVIEERSPGPNQRPTLTGVTILVLRASTSLRALGRRRCFDVG